MEVAIIATLAGRENRAGFLLLKARKPVAMMKMTATAATP
jgi:hypothetical protein